MSGRKYNESFCRIKSFGKRTAQRTARIVSVAIKHLLQKSNDNYLNIVRAQASGLALDHIV